jgi:hypothetical protein
MIKNYKDCGYCDSSICSWISATHLVDQFNVGASIIRKNVHIVCDVLIDKDKLMNKYNNIPLNQCLKDIIARFENFTCILNICGL